MPHQYTYLILILLGVCFLPSTAVFGQGIVGGNDVDEGKYPFMVGLIEAKEKNLVKAMECGGTVIGEKWVMTAGHCITGLNADDLEILVGTYNLEKPQQGYKRVKIEKIFLHPNYTRIPFTTPGGHQGSVPEMDIALIRLAEPIEGPVVQLPVVDDDSYEIDGLDVRVMGWGRHDTHTSTRSVTLKEASIQLIAEETCKEYDYYDLLVTDNMICAGQLKAGQTPTGGAAGDSGGPLIIEDNSGWLQLGIMSWGINYTEYERPGVYQKVYRHLQWIEHIIQANTPTQAEDLKLPEDIIAVLRSAQDIQLVFKETLGRSNIHVYSLDGKTVGFDRVDIDNGSSWQWHSPQSSGTPLVFYIHSEQGSWTRTIY